MAIVSYSPVDFLDNSPSDLPANSPPNRTFVSKQQTFDQWREFSNIVAADLEDLSTAFDSLNNATFGNGTVTSVSVVGGTGLTSSGSPITGSGSISLDVDLSGLTDMTQTMIATDEFIVLDGGNQRRKAASEIGLSIFNNDLSDLDLTNFAGGIVDTDLSSVSGSDDTLASAKSIKAYVDSSVAGAGSGDITGVNITAGSGLTGTVNTTSGTHTQTINVGAGSLIDVASDTISVDLSELVDMTQTFLGTDELVVLDGGLQRRKAANEIGLSIFNNDAGFTTNVGDITNISITAGLGLTGTASTSSGAHSQTIDIGQGTGISVSANSISTNDSQIVHDNLSGFVANEHIDHTSVSIGTGNGLSGGGNISASRTLTVDAHTGITVDGSGVSVKNSGNLSNNTIQRWNSVSGQFEDSSILDDGSTLTIDALNLSLNVQGVGAFPGYSATGGGQTTGLLVESAGTSSDGNTIYCSRRDAWAGWFATDTVNNAQGDKLLVFADMDGQSTTGGNQVGSITITSSSTAYNTSSDYRLKDNIVDIDNAIDRVKDISPRRFNFKSNPALTVDGFIAHELSGVVPESVTGIKDQVDNTGSPIYQQIDNSKIVPLLTAALQESITKIEELESRISQLES